MVVGELRGCPAIAVLAQSQAVGHDLGWSQVFFDLLRDKAGQHPKIHGQKGL